MLWQYYGGPWCAEWHAGPRTSTRASRGGTGLLSCVIAPCVGQSVQFLASITLGSTWQHKQHQAFTFLFPTLFLIWQPALASFARLHSSMRAKACARMILWPLIDWRPETWAIRIFERLAADVAMAEQTRMLVEIVPAPGGALRSCWLWALALEQAIWSSPVDATLHAAATSSKLLSVVCSYQVRERERDAETFNFSIMTLPYLMIQIALVYNFHYHPSTIISGTRSYLGWNYRLCSSTHGRYNKTFHTKMGEESLHVPSQPKGNWFIKLNHSIGIISCMKN